MLFEPQDIYVPVDDHYDIFLKAKEVVDLALGIAVEDNVVIQVKDLDDFATIQNMVENSNLFSYVYFKEKQKLLYPNFTSYLLKPKIGNVAITNLIICGLNTSEDISDCYIRLFYERSTKLADGLEESVRNGVYKNCLFYERVQL